MILYLCLNRNLVCFILLIQVGRYVFIVKCCSCTSENALTYKYRCHWPPLSCIVCICYGTWYIFTSAFLTISTHEFPLNFHPSRAAPRSCVATSRVVLEACSLPPRPEWFYIYACFCIEQRALWINHTVMILLFNISCTRDAPFLVTGLLLCQGGVVGEVVTGHLGARHRNTTAWPRPWLRQPAAVPLRILSATVTRQQGRGSDQTIHLEPSCFYKRLLALFALLHCTLTEHG